MGGSLSYLVFNVVFLYSFICNHVVSNFDDLKIRPIILIFLTFIGSDGFEGGQPDDVAFRSGDAEPDAGPGHRSISFTGEAQGTQR